MHVGLHAEWLTIPPDGKDLYVAVAGKDVTVVDNKTMQVVASIPVGAVPKRNTSGLLNEVTGNGIILRVQGKKITFAISCGTTAGLCPPQRSDRPLGSG